MDLREMMKSVDYPFSKSLVLLSTVIAAASTAFAVLILKEGEPSLQYLGSFAGTALILLYALATAILTFTILLIKVRLYSGTLTKETGEAYASGAEVKVKSFKRSLTLLYIAVIIVIIMIPLLALVTPSVWWFISVTSFISGINLSEVVIYLFSRRR